MDDRAKELDVTREILWLASFALFLVAAPTLYRAWLAAWKLAHGWTIENVLAGVRPLPMPRACLYSGPPAPPRPAPAFVSVLVFAKTRKGELTTFGQAREVSDRCDIRLEAFSPLTDVKIVVLCDLQRVKVETIFMGTELLHGALGECPFATWGEEWLPGTRALVTVSLRA